MALVPDTVESTQTESCASTPFCTNTNTQNYSTDDLRSTCPNSHLAEALEIVETSAFNYYQDLVSKHVQYLHSHFSTEAFYASTLQALNIATDKQHTIHAERLHMINNILTEGNVSRPEIEFLFGCILLDAKLAITDMFRIMLKALGAERKEEYRAWLQGVIQGQKDEVELMDMLEGLSLS